MEHRRWSSYRHQSPAGQRDYPLPCNRNGLSPEHSGVAGRQLCCLSNPARALLTISGSGDTTLSRQTTPIEASCHPRAGKAPSPKPHSRSLVVGVACAHCLVCLRPDRSTFNRRRNHPVTATNARPGKAKAIPGRGRTLTTGYFGPWYSSTGSPLRTHAV